MIERIDAKTHAIDIRAGWKVSSRQRKPGPPERIDGMTLGFVTMDGSSPHGGEVHPDGDEILLVITGQLEVRGDSQPDVVLELGPGDACVVPKGEWHNVEAQGVATFVHVTPGPNGDHR